MNNALPEIFVSRVDFERLSNLVSGLRSGMAEALEGELARATVVASLETPNMVVSMNSVINFKDLESGKESTITLVYPEHADFAAGKVSILAPVGVALIGLQMNEIIEWPMPNGNVRKLQVTSITSKAEGLD